MGRKFTWDELELSIYKAGYKLLNEYFGEDKNRRVIIEDENGYKCDCYMGAIKRGNNIKFMEKRNPYTLENISLFLKLNNKTYELCDGNTYIDAKSYLEFYCNVCKHNFYSIWDFLLRGYGCPICSGKQVGERTSLEYLRPDLTKEYLYSEHSKKPNEVTEFSGERVYWKCSECGHKWWATISNRTTNESGCPACSGNIVSDKNRFGLLFPDIAKEFHPFKNDDLTPNDVSYASSIKVWWLCSECRNEWKTSIAARTSEDGSNCPKCSESKGERKIRKFLDDFNIRFIPEFIIPGCKNKRELPFDFYLIDYGILIEYDGILHYKDKFNDPEEFKNVQLRDSIKTNFCLDNNIPLLRMPYWEFDNIEQILTDYLDL